MNSIKRVAVDRIVSALLEKAGLGVPPVDVEKIAQLLNLEIVKNPYKGKADFSGVLIRDIHKNIIGVNSNHHEHRQRFTIAHEIGHFLLHEGKQVFVDNNSKFNFRNTNSRLGTDLSEIEANTFASLLLIPETFLSRDLASHHINLSEQGDVKKISEEIEQLAVRLSEKYKVSPVSMLWRLINRLSQ